MRPITGITILGFRLGVIALAVYWTTLFLGTHWPSGINVAPDVSDKTKHFVGYFGLAILCCYVTQSPVHDPRRAAKRFLSVVLVLVAYACVDELTQNFSPGRHPEFLDALADTLGILMAVASYYAVRQVVRRISSRHVAAETVAAERSKS